MNERFTFQQSVFAFLYQKGDVDGGFGALATVRQRVVVLDESVCALFLGARAGLNTREDAIEAC